MSRQVNKNMTQSQKDIMSFSLPDESEDRFHFTQKQSALTVRVREKKRGCSCWTAKTTRILGQEAAKLKRSRRYYVTKLSTNVALSYKDKKVERATLTGGNSTYMNAVENEIVAGRSLRPQDYKEFASVILLDEELT